MKALYWSFFSALGWAVLAMTFTPTKSLAANPQHVSQLETTGQCESCDLSGAIFVGIDFSEVQVNLQNANLNGANFTGAIMPKVNLSGTSAVGSTFFGADLQGATLKNTNLLYANLVKAKLNNAILEKTDLYSANLAEADLSGAKVTKTNFVGANIYKMQYSPAIKDATLGNSFKSDRPNAQRVLRNGTTIIEKITGDRTLESGRSHKRRYRIPGWIGKPPTSTTEGSRQFNLDGTPLN
jgi:Pentapeptide repeats (8 copies)